MSDLPFMKLYWLDHLAATSHLTSEQYAAYDRLLGHMWLSGEASLPNDYALLVRLSGVHPPRWKRVRAAIAPMFTVDGDRITQKRLAAEWQAGVIQNERRKAAGRLGGQTTAFHRESGTWGGGHVQNMNRPKPLRTNGATSSNAAAVRVRDIKQPISLNC